MAVITKALGSGFGVSLGAGGTSLYQVLVDLLYDINNHTHTENTASAYTQNATSGKANSTQITSVKVE